MLGLGGDKKRQQRSLDYETIKAGEGLDQLWNPAFTGYNEGTKAALHDYGNIMGKYGNFAETGGFGAEDLNNIRSRSLSPFASVYTQAKNDINRNTSLSGGYSPNAAPAMARMAREMSSGLSDASRSTEAGIAQMVQQGKLAGMGGMASMYGATPGLASTFGNQALGVQGLQQDLGRWKTQGQFQTAQLPGAFQDFMGKAGQIGGLISNVAGIPGLNSLPGINKIFGQKQQPAGSLDSV